MTKGIAEGRAKVIRLVPVLLFITAIGASAYDWESYGGYDGTVTRYAFIQEAGNIDLANAILTDGFGDGIKVNLLFNIGENDVDAEDVQMLNDLEAFIPTEYELEDGDAYSYMVMRGETDAGVDGWIVFSHYLNSSGWYHFVYYFEISAEE